MAQKTFLELCQMTARESGTFSGTVPLTVTGQTGRLLKLVTFVRSAWRDIQLAKPTWKFMRQAFLKDLQIGTGQYSAATLNIDDFARWLPVIEEGNGVYSLYDDTIGVADEGAISSEISWQNYRARYVRGSQVNNRPTEIAISPANELCIGPLPDKAYKFRGEFYRSPQELEDDTDIPLLPAEYHEIIGWGGLAELAALDEAPGALARATFQRARIMQQMEFTQLDQVRFRAEPIA